jgi:hypothetical protein
MRRLRCADTIQTADGIAITIANDVTPTNHRRDNALHTRETCASVEPRRRDRLKGLQAGVRPAEGHHQGGMHDDSNST